MKKILTLTLAIIMMCGIMMIPAYASDDGIMPYFNNTITANVHFDIDENGKAVASLRYIGYLDCATSGTITATIQKKVGSDWQDVEGASWVDNTTDWRLNVEHTFPLTERGTYRLSYKIVVRGTGGTPDVIEDTIEDTY